MKPSTWPSANDARHIKMGIEAARVAHLDTPGPVSEDDLWLVHRTPSGGYRLTCAPTGATCELPADSLPAVAALLELVARSLDAPELPVDEAPLAYLVGVFRGLSSRLGKAG